MDSPEPTLIMLPCGCRRADCYKTTVAIRNPQMVEFEGQLIPVAYLRPEAIESLVRFLNKRRRDWMKGVSQ